MKWAIVAIGRVKERFYRDAIAEYLGRLQHYRAVSVQELAEEKLIPGRETQVMRKEAERIEGACRTGVRIALTERGERLTTAQLTARLAQFEGRGEPTLTFILGGPQGLDPDFIRRCDMELSLSPLTFPYQLARVVLLEQLYRCETLRCGEPYHKD